MPFLEETLPDCVAYGSAFGRRHATQLVVDAVDNTYASLRHPYPINRYELGFENRDWETMIEQVLDLYHRCGGMFGGFRIRDRADFSTNNYRDTPTAGDQPLVALSTLFGTYQLMRWYGSPADPKATRRRIRKPVPGTVKVGIASGGIVYPTAAFTVDTTTGVVALGADKQRTVTGITQAAQAVVTVGSGHGIVIGDSVVFTDVDGMTEINGRRGAVLGTTSSTITVGINTTGFTAYTSGGQVNTRPVESTGDQVTGGCLFDIPVRFETDLSDIAFANVDALSTDISLVELLNPDPQQ